MNPTILVCGEALYDIFIGDEAEGALALDARIGGSPLNVAVGLSRLGINAAFLAGLSDDLFGDRLFAHLENEGVSTKWIARKDAPTTLSIVGLDESGSLAYAFYGKDAADRLVTANDLPTLGADVGALHFGSYSLAVDPVGESLMLLAEREHQNRVISYDPNIRPTIEPDLGIWRTRLDRMSAVTHIIKISREDFDLLYPGAETGEMASRWLSRGAALVLLTEGKSGAMAWMRDGQTSVPGQSVETIDTVGAGDTFQAAVLARLSELGHLSVDRLPMVSLGDLTELLRFACRASAITCSRRGADLPYRDEI